MKTYSYRKLLEKELKNPAFRREYGKLGKEFAIAQEVIRLRLQAGLTQQALAGKVHTSQPAIARLESGQYRNLNLSFLNRIGRALGAVPEVHFRKVKAA